LIELHRPTQVLLWTGLRETYSLLDVESDLSGWAWLAEFSRLARMLEILIFDWSRSREVLQAVSAEAGWVKASSSEAENHALAQSVSDLSEAAALSQTVGRLSALKWMDDPRARVRAWLGFAILQETMLRRRSASSMDENLSLDRETAGALLRDSSQERAWDPALVAMARSKLQFADLRNDQAAVEEIKALAGPPLRFVDLDEAWRRDRSETGRSLDAYFWDQKRPWDLYLSEVGHQLVAETLTVLWVGASSEGEA
jgi:hypothetical protein